MVDEINNSRAEGRAMEALNNHKEAEKRRRQRINSHLDNLRTLLPLTSKVTNYRIIILFNICYIST